MSKKAAAAAIQQDNMPTEPVVIMPICNSTIEIPIEGVSPLMICGWSAKAEEEMRTKQQTGKRSARAVKAPKNPEQCYHEARYIAEPAGDDPGGWDGINAVSFRGAMISACRLIDGLTMTLAKQLLFVVADGHDRRLIPLVRIHGEPRMHEGHVRVGQGTADLRYRPIYWPWRAVVRVTYNPQWITGESIANLLAIAGDACGVGEWRPTSPKCLTGTLGRWRLVSTPAAAAA